MKYILMDVEGTTTSITFVHDILFPYSSQRISSYIKEHSNDSFVKEILDQTQSTVLMEEGKVLNQEELINKLLQWIKDDRKHGALKKLQGLIWNEGYEKGEIKGHVYAEVPEAFINWTKKGIRLGIYSSGSVEAQRALFAHSIFGNLNTFISHNFDTGVGNKREVQSYKNILELIKYNPQDVLFLSDITEELDAAKLCGIQTLQLIRLQPVLNSSHEQIKNFQVIRI